MSSSHEVGFESVSSTGDPLARTLRARVLGQSLCHPRAHPEDSRRWVLRAKPSTAAATNGTGARVAISALREPTSGLLRSPVTKSALSLFSPNPAPCFFFPSARRAPPPPPP